MAEVSEILVQCQPSFNGTVPARVQVFLIVRAISALLLCFRGKIIIVFMWQRSRFSRRQVTELIFLLLGLNPENLQDF